MTIINSLGSNYDFKFVNFSLSQLFVSNKNNLDKLKKLLELQYKGKGFLFYKGRDAIEFGLRVKLKPNSKVITQAFSCYAVEEGIKRAGMIPVYADIGSRSTNMTLETIKDTYRNNPKVKAILVQHSLGISAEIDVISDWCRKNNILLIEDIAQAIGGIYEDGERLGSKADITIFSFGRDKIIDAISGGAIVFSALTKDEQNRVNSIKVESIPRSVFIKDMLYPIITFKHRVFHRIYLGRVIFKVSKMLGLLTSPIKSSTDTISYMHPGYAALALYQFENLDKQLFHRREITALYNRLINSNLVKKISDKKELIHGSNLRYPLKSKDYKKLFSYLKKNRVYISDRWYRSAVDCGPFKCKTSYKTGSCPNAEKLVTQIINLPTHINCSTTDARKIISLINNL